jgi:hypothetical protein
VVEVARSVGDIPNVGVNVKFIRLLFAHTKTVAPDVVKYRFRFSMYAGDVGQDAVETLLKPR